MIRKLRLHASKLNRNGSRYLLKGFPFSGLAYCFSNEQTLETILDVEDGIAVGISSDMIQAERKLLRVDFDALDNDLNSSLDRYTYAGKLFQGIAYEFDEDGFLMDETYMDPDYVADRTWYSNGQFESDKSKFDENLAWYENGQLRYIDSKTKSEYFNEDGTLGELKLSQDVDLKRIDFSIYRISEDLVLSNLGVHSGVLESLIKFKKNHLKFLELNNTNVTEFIIMEIDFSELSKLVFEQNMQISYKTARKFKKKYPKCTVIFDNDIIEYEQRLRVRHENVEIDNEKYLLKDREFNGYTYQFTDDDVTINEVIDGKANENNDEEIFPGRSIKRIDFSRLQPSPEFSEIEPERFVLHEVEFEGISYRFDKDGFLIEEACYNPEKSTTRQWYSTGQKKYLKESATEYQSWYENGQTHELHYESGTLIKYNEDGTIYWLSHEEETPNDINTWRYRISNNMTIKGIGIGNELFISVLRQDSLKALRNLKLENTNITDSAFESSLMDHLASLTLIKNDFISQHKVEELIQTYPQCSITFEP